jgi:hypothetical protein
MKKKTKLIIYTSLILIITIIIFTFIIYKLLQNSKHTLQNPIFLIFDTDLEDEKWDMHFDNVKKANGNYVLLSPIQPINLYNNQWWSKYQPLSYIITEEMQKKLTNICIKANQKNIKIIVDVVWSHTSITIYNEKTKYRYKEKNVAQQGIDIAPDKIKKMWFSEGLPSLNTELQELKDDGRRAVEIMRKCGVSGFRMDAANYMDEDFFNYVYNNSPKDEIHIYEVWVQNINPYDKWRLNRINNDKCEVLFYDLSTYFYIRNSINDNKQKNTIFPCIPSDFSMNAIINHDLSLQHNNDSPLYLYMYFLMSLFTGNQKYFIYTIFTNQGSESSTFIQNLLFNWDNYFNNVQKFLKLKEKTPDVLGTIEIFKYNNSDEPMIVGSIGKNYKMLLNLKNSVKSSTDNIPCKKLFGTTCKDLDLINLLNNKKFDKQNYSEDYIYCPDFSYSIIRNRTTTLNKKIDIIMFWYQGYIEMPDWAKKSLKIWSEFENSNVIFVDRQSLNTILTKDELNVVLTIEEKIEKPWVYAAVCDYIRWVLLLKNNGGIYIDCDVFPSSTSKYLLNCVNEYDYLILGREPSNFINNAIIIASPKSCYIIKIIADQMVKNIYEKEVFNSSLNDIYKYDNLYDDVDNLDNVDNMNSMDNISDTNNNLYDSYYSNAYNAYNSLKDTDNNEYFNWIIKYTGPSFIKDVISKKFKENKDILILDSIWLYSAYYATTKVTDENCGNNIGLIQHCYASNWVKK